MKRQEVLKAAKGHVQESIIWDLLTHGETQQLSTYMKTQRQYSRYCQSFSALIWRLRHKYGLAIEYVPGIRGGSWTAKYVLV